MPAGSHIDLIRERAKVAEGDRVEEARIAYEASRGMAGDGWRALYLAYWASEHPAPAPKLDGHLFAGDRVMGVGRQGAEEGPAVVDRIWHDTSMGRVITLVSYTLLVPFGDKVGAESNVGSLAHERDWPVTMLGEFPQLTPVPSSICNAPGQGDTGTNPGRVAE